MKKIDWMYKSYGKRHGYKCRDCCNLACNTWGRRRFYKCLAWGDTNGAGTDWALSWPACGLFGVPFDPRLNKLGSAMKLHETRVNANEPIDGQITFSAIDHQ